MPDSSYFRRILQVLDERRYGLLPLFEQFVGLVLACMVDFGRQLALFPHEQVEQQFPFRVAQDGLEVHDGSFLTKVQPRWYPCTILRLDPSRGIAHFSDS
jgi:hypothetical protein